MGNKKYRIRCGSLRGIFKGSSMQEAFINGVKKKNPKGLGALVEAYCLGDPEDGDHLFYISSVKLLEDAGLMKKG